MYCFLVPESPCALKRCVSYDRWIRLSSLSGPPLPACFAWWTSPRDGGHSPMMDWYVSASSSSLCLTSRHNFRNAASGNSNFISFSSFLNISRSHLPDKHGMNSPDGQEPCFLFRLSSTSHIWRELLSRTRGISVYAAYFPRRFHFIDLHIHYIRSGIFLIAPLAFFPVSTEYQRIASLQHF